MLLSVDVVSLFHQYAIFMIRSITPYSLILYVIALGFDLTARIIGQVQGHEEDYFDNSIFEK